MSNSMTLQPQPDVASQAAAGTRRAPRYSVAEINALKARDNWTNWKYLALNWGIIVATLTLSIWGEAELRAAGHSVWWVVPIAIVTIIVIGASQHQLGGAIHEGTHFYLFKNRSLNELASDWLAAFPIYTSTHHFRLHHLSHHQFVNDPERDPNFAQAKDSGHWLDFPLTHVDMLRGFLRLLWIPNLVSYTVARARYSALGLGSNPYGDPDRQGHWMAAAVGVLFAVGVPTIAGVQLALGVGAATTLDTMAAIYLATVVFYVVIPDDWFQGSRIEPVFSHRSLHLQRLTFMALVYASLTAIDLTGYQKAWGYYLLYWIVPLFTSFPVFMILREWLQHGNADRGKMTNSRVFLTGPIFNYAVMPWGMDYHLPHHLMSSVPHYNLKKLHELLLRDPEYREKGVIVEGYIGATDAETGRPTALGILHVDHAPKVRAAAHVDETVLDDADVNDRAAMARISQASRDAEAGDAPPQAPGRIVAAE
jgi:fatty acid desaturase